MPDALPRCQMVPHAEQQVGFEVEGRECLRWHFSDRYPRPFFYPLRGPCGRSLTRMGHPGAPNHDHHRSVWFAHAKVLGIDFWSDRGPGRIRQQQWLCYADTPTHAAMAVRLGWYDGHNPDPLLEQQLVAVLFPDRDRQYQLELQSTFEPRAEQLELEQTNFGMLAVRVARNLSAHFGGGELSGSEGRRGEAALFGQPARWMDYSGPVAGEGDAPREGITYFDHLTNPGYPHRWHVREDGWMGASVCFDGPRQITRATPLRLRFLLDIHRGDYDADRATRLAKQFAEHPGWDVVKANAKHESFRIVPALGGS